MDWGYDEDTNALIDDILFDDDDDNKAEDEGSCLFKHIFDLIFG